MVADPITEDVGFPSSQFGLSRRSVSDELDPKELEGGLVLRVYRDATKALEDSWDLFWSTEPGVSSASRWASRWASTVPEEFLSFITNRAPGPWRCWHTNAQ